MLLHAEHAGPDALARFRREAEALAALKHDGIVEVYEVGQHDGTPFLSLEYAEGGTLDRRLAGNPQPPRDAAAGVERLALAVQAAHTAGIVHRDLKPANVLIADGPDVPLASCRLRVTDFGLAKRDGDQGKTASGVVMGSPPYMAPEQAAGRSKEVG